MNPQVVMFFVGLAVVVIVGIVLWAVARRSKSERLREHFGAEYDRAVEQTGSRTAADRTAVVSKSSAVRP